MNNRNFQCLIVDDEPPARDLLRRYAEQLPMLSVAGECANAVQAMVLMQQKPIDLLFLDIHMPKLSGIDLLHNLLQRPKTILTTAYEKYAVQAFDLNVVDYLLKPIAFDRFVKAVLKATTVSQEAAARSVPAAEIEPPFLYFRADRRMVKVFFDNIVYIESLKDYVRIRTTSGDVITKHSMAALDALLPNTQFIRVHRSFIASLLQVTSFTSDQLTMAGESIPIGKLYRLQVLHKLEARKK